MDILAANGHVTDDIEKPTQGYTMPTGATYAQRPLLLRNIGTTRGVPQFTDISRTSGAALLHPLVARGLALADIDLDGDTDALLTTNGGAPHLLRNDAARSHNALRLELRGARSNRSAIGTRVEARFGGETLHRTVHGSSSYLSQSELPLTIGLGSANRIETLTIHWPSGDVTTLQNVAANSSLLVDESAGLIRQTPLRRVG